MDKKCFKCDETKNITLFYKHNQMSDGYLGKCKQCAKDDSNNRRYAPRFREYVLKYDRDRRKKGFIKIKKEKKEKKELKYRSWSGTNSDYRNLHRWVENQLGKPDKCSSCNKNGLYGHSIHWANENGKYNKTKNDWIRLCVSCHRKYDSQQFPPTKDI